MNRKEVLIQARSLIAEESNWCKGEYKRHSLSGCAYCAIGAIYEVSYLNKRLDILGSETQISREAIIAIACNGLKRGYSIDTYRAELMEFNDSPDTTHAEVLSVFDQAIAALD